MDYKQKLVESGIKMLEKGLTVETWGNISLRDPETGLIYLTPSAMPYNTIQPKDVVVMRSDGTVAEGFRKPTIEWPMHLGIYAKRPDLCAIIHTHPVESQVFAVLHEDIPPIIDEAAQALKGPVRCSAYALPGTKELAENTAEALGNGMACLMANHGAVCTGATIEQAFKVCTVLEMTAKIYRIARSIGNPEAIPADKVAYMVDYVSKRYGQNK